MEDIKNGDIDVLVTAPINKKAMVAEGFGNTGHTEYLQKEFGVDDVLMFMVSDQLRISVVTGHIPLKDVPVNHSGEDCEQTAVDDGLAEEGFRHRGA